MRTSLRRLAALGLIVVAAAAGATSASARVDGKKHSSLRSVVNRAAADYLGMQRRELRRTRRSGRSLVEIAASRGKPAGVFAAALARATGVPRGEIEKLIRQTPGSRFGGGGQLGKILTTAAAHYLRVPHEALVSKLQSGRSLAGVAAAQKRSVAGLRLAMRAAVVAKLEHRVAAGTLSAKRKHKLLARADRKIERLVTRAA